MRSKDTKQQASSICSQDQIADKFILLPAACSLKSQDSPDGPITLADKVPKTIQRVKSREEQLDNPIAKISYCPSLRTFLETSYCDDKTRNQPIILIEYGSRSEDPLITQCSTSSTDSDKISRYICPKSEGEESPGEITRQAITDDTADTTSDQRAKNFCGQDLTGQEVPCERMQPEVTYRTSPDGKLTCRDRADLRIDISSCSRVKDLLSRVPRRNGLDSSEIKRSSKREMSRRQICPASCCPPARRSTTKEVRKDSPRSRRKGVSNATASPIKVCTPQDCLDYQHLQRPVSEQKLRTEVERIGSAKSDNVSVYQTAAVRQADSTPESAFEGAIQSAGSQELPACCKKYIPAYQKRYEVCPFRRNGLQNEYVPLQIQQSETKLYLG